MVSSGSKPLRYIELEDEQKPEDLIRDWNSEEGVSLFRKAYESAKVIGESTTLPERYIRISHKQDGGVNLEYFNKTKSEKIKGTNGQSISVISFSEDYIKDHIKKPKSSNKVMSYLLGNRKKKRGRKGSLKSAGGESTPDNAVDTVREERLASTASNRQQEPLPELPPSETNTGPTIYVNTGNIGYVAPEVRSHKEFIEADIRKFVEGMWGQRPGLDFDTKMSPIIRALEEQYQIKINIAEIDVFEIDGSEDFIKHQALQGAIALAAEARYKKEVDSKITEKARDIWDGIDQEEKAPEYDYIIPTINKIKDCGLTLEDMERKGTPEHQAIIDIVRFDAEVLLRANERSEILDIKYEDALSNVTRELAHRDPAIIIKQEQTQRLIDERTKDLIALVKDHKTLESSQNIDYYINKIEELGIEAEFVDSRDSPQDRAIKELMQFEAEKEVLAMQRVQAKEGTSFASALEDIEKELASKDPTEEIKSKLDPIYMNTNAPHPSEEPYEQVSSELADRDPTEEKKSKLDPIYMNTNAPLPSEESPAPQTEDPPQEEVYADLGVVDSLSSLLWTKRKQLGYVEGTVSPEKLEEIYVQEILEATNEAMKEAEKKGDVEKLLESFGIAGDKSDQLKQIISKKARDYLVEKPFKQLTKDAKLSSTDKGFAVEDEINKAVDARFEKLKIAIEGVEALENDQEDVLAAVKKEFGLEEIATLDSKIFGSDLDSEQQGIKEHVLNSIRYKYLVEEDKKDKARAEAEELKEQERLAAEAAANEKLFKEIMPEEVKANNELIEDYRLQIDSIQEIVTKTLDVDKVREFNQEVVLLLNEQKLLQKENAEILEKEASKYSDQEDKVRALEYGKAESVMQESVLDGSIDIKTYHYRPTSEELRLMDEIDISNVPESVVERFDYVESLVDQFNIGANFKDSFRGDRKNNAKALFDVPKEKEMLQILVRLEKMGEGQKVKELTSVQGLEYLGQRAKKYIELESDGNLPAIETEKPKTELSKEEALERRFEAFRKRIRESPDAIPFLKEEFALQGINDAMLEAYGDEYPCSVGGKVFELEEVELIIKKAIEVQYNKALNAEKSLADVKESREAGTKGLESPTKVTILDKSIEHTSLPKEITEGMENEIASNYEKIKASVTAVIHDQELLKEGEIAKGTEGKIKDSIGRLLKTNKTMYERLGKLEEARGYDSLIEKNNSGDSEDLLKELAEIHKKTEEVSSSKVLSTDTVVTNKTASPKVKPKSSRALFRIGKKKKENIDTDGGQHASQTGNSAKETTSEKPKKESPISAAQQLAEIIVSSVPEQGTRPVSLKKVVKGGVKNEAKDAAKDVQVVEDSKTKKTPSKEKILEELKKKNLYTKKRRGSAGKIASADSRDKAIRSSGHQTNA